MVALTAAPRLTLLGPPSVRLADGREAVPLSAKALGILIFLTLDAGPHTREELASLMWSESSDAEARASLRQALMQLRKLPGCVRCDRTTVEVQFIQCDLTDFRRLVPQQPELTLTTEIPRFLAGFSVRNAPRFDEWLAGIRSEVTQQYQQGIATLAREAMGRWRWRDALELAARWLASDPLSDEAARLVVESCYLGGDRGGALARFVDYRSTLKRETGCEPSRSLLALVQRVEADSGSAKAHPVTDEWYSRSPSFEARLIGRDEEWKQLIHAFRNAVRGRGSVVLIEGEPGVGKTRLAHEFGRWVVTAGGTLLRGHGYDVRTGVPFEPLVEILRDALDAPGLAGTAPEWLTEVGLLLPELRQRFPALPAREGTGDSTESWRLYEGVAQLVLALAAERPLAVLLDDLHWCDADSCNLLRFVLRRTEQAPVLWIMTVTVGELEHDAPAARLLRVLRAKSHTAVLTPGPLNEENVWLMIRELGHVSAPTGARRFAHRILGATGGNPFYVIELLKTMFAQGFLSTDGATGEWTMGDGIRSGQFHISSTVQAVIAERVERLPEPLRDALVTLAVAGSGCSAELLSQLHGIARLHAAALGEALVVRGLVVDDGGFYRCVHPVVAKVVRDGLTPSRRREMHRSVALGLERLTPPSDVPAAAGEIARHAGQGGEPALAYRYALLASSAAAERYAHGEALSWLALAGSNVRNSAEVDEVKRRKDCVLEAAGWSESPVLAQLGGPLTREIDRVDLDLRGEPV
jgi:DNA-binding SARP family transcriptional activator